MTTTFRPLEAEDRERLHEMIIAGFLDGECYAFAIALCRGTGWPMFGLMEGKTVRHALVLDPKGILHDARGAVNEEELGRPFDLSPPYVLESVSEEELFSIKPVSEYTIESVSRKAQILWPELPWKADTLNIKVRSFSQELERLSRKYGLWLRSYLPNTPPVIAEKCGGEKGYEINLTLDGSYTVNRIFK